MDSVRVQPSHGREYILALLLTLLGAVLFSVKGVFIKFAYQYQVDTVTLLTLRMAIAVPVYLLIGFYSERFYPQRISRRQLFIIACFGFLGYYLASYLDMQGLHYISVSLERVILYLYPTFVLILSAIVFRQRIKTREAIALMIAYAGIVLIFFESFQLDAIDYVRGSVLVAMSAFVFAIFMLGSDKHIKLVGSVRFTAYAMSAAGFAVFVYYLLSARSGLFDQHTEVYIWASVLAVLSTIIPTFFISHGMKILGAKKVSMLGVVGPVSTLIIGVLFLDERINSVQLAGMITVIMAVSFIVIFNKPDKD